MDLWLVFFKISFYLNVTLITKELSKEKNQSVVVIKCKVLILEIWSALMLLGNILVSIVSLSFMFLLAPF